MGIVNKGDNMIDIGGVILRFDLEAYSKLLLLKNGSDNKEVECETTVINDSDGNTTQETITKREFDKNREVDAIKYDLVKTCLEIILINNDELDDKLGLANSLASLPISFKIAYNTLIEYGILVEVN